MTKNVNYFCELNFIVIEQIDIMKLILRPEISRHFSFRYMDVKVLKGNRKSLINLFVPNAPFLYLLKTSENLKVF